MRNAVFAVVLCLSVSGMARAQPAPCGPAGDLSEELSGNVAADSRCFEIRMYTADTARDGVGNFKGGIDEFCTSASARKRSRSSRSTAPR